MKTNTTTASIVQEGVDYVDYAMKELKALKKAHLEAS
jgi:hypothetical protein